MNVKSDTIVYLLEALETHRLILSKVATKYTRKHAEVQDVLQDLRVKILALKADTPRPDCAKYWLIATLRNHCFNLHRARKYESSLSDLHEGHYTAPDWRVHLEGSLEAERQLGAVMAALARMPANERDAFLLRRVRGMSQDAVAATFGCTVRQVQRYLRSALTTLSSIAGRDLTRRCSEDQS